MLIAEADFPFLEFLWSMMLFFAWVAWIWIAITCFIDIFRRHDIGGGCKALWVLFIILIPFLGVLVYLIAQHDGMRERSVEQAKDQKAAFDEYVKRHRRRPGRRDREGQGPARLRSDHPGGVRRDQGQSAGLLDGGLRPAMKGPIDPAGLSPLRCYWSEAVTFPFDETFSNTSTSAAVSVGTS